MQKETKMTWLFPQILMIKLSCNFIGWKAQLATPNQKRRFHIAPSLDDYFHVKNLRDWLIIFRDSVNQSILQSDWTRGIICHLQPKVVVLDAAFHSLPFMTKIPLEFTRYHFSFWKRSKKLFCKNFELYFRLFFQNDNFSEKFGFFSFWLLRPSNLYKVSKKFYGPNC